METLARTSRRKQYHMFWTAGLDSSFRLTQLAQREVEIFPVYVIFPWRPSTPYEIKRHTEFMEWLANTKKIRAAIHPVQYVKAEEISVLPEIRTAIREVCSKYQQFGEYDHLSSYAAQHPGVELCIPWNPPGREIPIIKIINKALGGLQIDEEGTGWVHDPENKAPEVMKAIGNFSYPLAKIRNWDYESILETQGFNFAEFISRTWSCYAPFHGDRCGVCRSCRGKLMHVPYMKKYYSPAAQRRFKVWQQLGQTGEPVIESMFYTGTQSQRELVMAVRGVLLKQQEKIYTAALENFKSAGNEYGVKTVSKELKRIAEKRQKYLDMLEAVS